MALAAGSRRGRDGAERPVVLAWRAGLSLGGFSNELLRQARAVLAFSEGAIAVRDGTMTLNEFMRRSRPASPACAES